MDVRAGLWKKLRVEELMLLNCGVGEDSWESLGQRGDPTSPSKGWTWCTWVWMNSRSWWWTGRPGVLRFMGSRRVRHDWATELNWLNLLYTCIPRNKKKQWSDRQFPASALMITPYVRSRKTLEHTGLKASYFLLITVFELMRTPLRLVILCLRMSWLEKGDLTHFWFHLRIIYFFFVLDTTLMVLRNSKNSTSQGQWVINYF